MLLARAHPHIFAFSVKFLIFFKKKMLFESSEIAWNPHVNIRIFNLIKKSSMVAFRSARTSSSQLNLPTFAPPLSPTTPSLAHTLSRLLSPTHPPTPTHPPPPNHPFNMSSRRNTSDRGSSTTADSVSDDEEEIACTQAPAMHQDSVSDDEEEVPCTQAQTAYPPSSDDEEEVEILDTDDEGGANDGGASSGDEQSSDDEQESSGDEQEESDDEAEEPAPPADAVASPVQPERPVNRAPPGAPERRGTVRLAPEGDVEGAPAAKRTLRFDNVPASSASSAPRAGGLYTLAYVYARAQKAVHGYIASALSVVRLNISGELLPLLPVGCVNFENHIDRMISVLDGAAIECWYNLCVDVLPESPSIAEEEQMRKLTSLKRMFAAVDVAGHRVSEALKLLRRALVPIEAERLSGSVASLNPIARVRAFRRYVLENEHARTEFRFHLCVFFRCLLCLQQDAVSAFGDTSRMLVVPIPTLNMPPMQNPQLMATIERRVDYNVRSLEGANSTNVALMGYQVSPHERSYAPYYDVQLAPHVDIPACIREPAPRFNAMVTFTEDAVVEVTRVTIDCAREVIGTNLAMERSDTAPKIRRAIAALFARVVGGSTPSAAKGDAAQSAVGVNLAATRLEALKLVFTKSASPPFLVVNDCAEDIEVDM